MRRPVAQRGEFQVLLPAALVLLVILSTYALLSYRGAVSLLLEERQAEAEALARQLRNELVEERALPGAEELRQRSPNARYVAILDAGGEILASTDPRAVVAAPDEAGEGLVSGTARLKRGSRTLTVRIDLPATLLRSRERGLAVLTPVLLGVNAAVTVLVLVFLRRFLAPFDRLVERARHAGQEVPDSKDTVEFLVETFEEALEVLSRPAPDAPTDADELKALEDTLARSLESGVLLCDAGGAVLALNEIGASLLDLPSWRLGEPVAETLERHRELAALLGQAIRQEQAVQRVECSIATAAGERTLGVTAHPLRRDDGQVRGFLVIFADLTEVQRENRERQLADSLAQLGELTAGVAHELRNSLATLRGYLALIERDPEQESITDYLSEIRRESDHLQRVLEDFLTFARPGSARLEEVDLLGLLHRAASDPALGETTVTVESEEAGRGYRVRGDPQLLERAVRNVLHNAGQAQRESGCREPVAARLAAGDGGVEIRIEDRGPGLAPAAREKLFAPFATQREGGVGLGLALTRRIVLLHSGRVELEDRPRGGTRAVIWIPRGKTVTMGNEPEGSDPSPGADGDDASH